MLLISRTLALENNSRRERKAGGRLGPPRPRPNRPEPIEPSPPHDPTPEYPGPEEPIEPDERTGE